MKNSLNQIREMISGTDSALTLAEQLYEKYTKAYPYPEDLQQDPIEELNATTSCSHLGIIMRTLNLEKKNDY